MAAHQEKARALNAVLAFLDASGLLMAPLVRRTWAPRGQTPRLAQRPILVVWDRLGAHRGHLIRRFLRRCRRVEVEFLPPSAPELNPVERLWSHLKRNPLAHYAPADVAAIHRVAHREIRRLRRRSPLLRTCLASTPLSLCSPV